MIYLFIKFLPDHYYDDGGINERIFQNRSVFHIVIISALVAFCEEVLFRGVIQTHFGLVVSSIIFALIHFRYLFNWFLFLNVVLLSFFIGYIYMITDNLSVTIFMHFLIDCLLGLTIRLKHYKIERNGRDDFMNKEDPYRQKTDDTRQRIQRAQTEEKASTQRNYHHAVKSIIKQRKKAKPKKKISYPIIRLLGLFFILLPDYYFCSLFIP